VRTLKNLAPSLIIMVLTTFVSKAAILRGEPIAKCSSNEKKFSVENKITNGNYVRAKVVNGMIIPQVSLPMVTIITNRKSKKNFSAIKKGKIYISIIRLLA
jgi:hypothetical protein